MKLLIILTTADIRGVGPGVWNGWKAQLIRTLYYETEPVLTGGFSEVNRAERIRAAQAEFRAAFTEIGRRPSSTAYIARHYPAYWLKVELPRKIRHARFLRASEQAGHKLAINVGFDEARGVTELTILAPSTIPGCCRSSPAPAPPPAPTSSTPRSTPPPTAARSTPSRSPANTIVTRTRAAAPPGSAT